MNVIRRSQVIGLMAMDGSTASEYDCIEEVWLDESGRVIYLGGREGYIPIEQISIVGDDAVLTYSSSFLKPETNLFHINRHLRNKNFLVKLSSLMNFANLK
jgi:hypothetical protein